MKILSKNLRFILAIYVISLALSGSALAVTTTATPSVTAVELSSDSPDQSAFTFNITVKADYDFVGVQVKLAVSDETALKCTGYTKSAELADTYSVSPRLKDGVYYFGFFATDSTVFNGELNIGTLSFTYTGNDAQTITLDSLDVVIEYDAQTQSSITTVKGDNTFTVNVARANGATTDTGGTPTDPGGTTTTTSQSSTSTGVTTTSSGTEVTTTILEDTDVPLAGSFMSVETELENGVLYYYGTNGEAVYIPFSLYIDGVMYFIGNPLVEYYITENPKSFTDVADHWAAESISRITSREVYVGFPDGSFGPNLAMTRAQLAKVLAAMATADVTSYTSRVFDDVDPMSWYGPYVAWAASAGIVMGDGNGSFRPDSEVSRQEMAVMLSRFISYASLSVPAGSAGTAFGDYEQIADWAKSAAAEMQKYGIITGKTGNLFAPTDNSTRAEVATMLWRLIESVVKELVK